MNHVWRLGLVILLFITAEARGQYVPAQLPLTQLPQEHDYQRTLRDFLGTLTAKDLLIERKEFTTPADLPDEEQYRLWLLTLHLPAVQAAALPAEAFTLRTIESGKGLALPAAPSESQMLAWLANWQYPGNPHHGTRAVKLRALILAIIDLVMLDYLYEHAPQGADRSDFLGGNLIWIGYTFKTTKDVLPASVRTAFETGLKKHLARLTKWGPKGAMTDMDLFAPVGLWYCAEALADADVKRAADGYAKRMFTDPRSFHPAGYFVDVGCFDTSYNGISLYFSTWAALAGDWAFATEAVSKGYRLRNHLSLPEPDGRAFGPSHMSSRTSADPPHDQWNFPHRPYAAAMVTDEALHLAPLPGTAVMKQAAQRVTHHFNELLGKPQPVTASTWKETHWSGAFNFTYEHYKKGYYGRRLALEKEASPLLKPLYQRGERFIHEFDNAFLVACFDGYVAAIHTGPVRGWPHGLGGGMLSAFWTPSTGPTVLGRRRGMQGPVRDSLDEWRNWPVNAISGTSAAGELFSSAFLTKPEVKYEVKEQHAEARVEGPIAVGKDAAALHYQRRFVVRPAGLTVDSSLEAKSPVKIGELVESIPLYLNDTPQLKGVEFKVELQIGDQWLAASPKPQADVKSIRIDRHQGGMLVTLDRPRTVHLAPVWTDGFQSTVTCQALLVNLADKATELQTAKLAYTLAPLPRKK